MRALALLLTIVIAGCEGTAAEPRAADQAADAPVPVEVASARREQVAAIYATSGTLRAEKQATVASRTRGVVRQLVVEEGTEVEAEQVLAVLEDEQQRIEQERARVVLETTKRALERMERLGTMRPLAELETAQRDFEEAKHRAALAELELSRTVIRAPFAGRVLKRYVDLGATVSDGTTLFDLADCDPLMADVAVPERHVTRLAVGQPVRLLVDATTTSLGARIERIAPSVDPATGTVKVSLAVAGGEAVRPGAFVRVGIVTDLRPDALVVPRNALVPEGRRWHVYRLRPEGDAVDQIEVALGFEEGDKVECLPPPGAETARFLREGERVVVVGAAALAPGRKVTLPGAPPAPPSPVGVAPAATVAAPATASRG